jgi:hypothetical protein
MGEMNLDDWEERQMNEEIGNCWGTFPTVLGRWMNLWQRGAPIWEVSTSQQPTRWQSERSSHFVGEGAKWD